MSIAHLLQDFGVAATSNMIVVTDVDLEEQKLSSYEAGYQAGWDDSAASNRDAGKQISADFLQNMRDLSMTYHEAHGALMADLQPMLTQIVNSVLPELAHDALAPRIVELIEKAMQDGSPPSVILTAAPRNCDLLSKVVEEFEGQFAIELTPDETLADGQVQLRFGQSSEQELDAQSLITGIQEAVQGFFQSRDDTLKEIA